MTENVTGVQIEIDPSTLQNPTLAFLKSYWDLKRGTRDMPARADIEPSEMKEHLGWLLLLDVLPDAQDFRFRMVGTRVTEYLLTDASGKTVTEALAPYGEAALEAVLVTHRRVAEERLPLRVHGGAGLFGRAFLDFDAIFLPLSADGHAVNMILSAFTFDQSALLKARAGPSQP